MGHVDGMVTVLKDLRTWSSHPKSFVPIRQMQRILFAERILQRTTV